MAAGGEQTRSAHARDVSLGARISDKPAKPMFKPRGGYSLCEGDG